MADQDAYSAMSESTELSEHYMIKNPELGLAETPIMNQFSAVNSFKRIIASSNVQIIEAYPGALSDLKGLNPDYFAVPYGTRVINIKTPSVENVRFSIRNKVWSTLDKVSERIMKIWDARQDSKEKVLFLFAVTGSSHFCGVAEMSGPWDRSQSIEGWKDDTHESTGSIPLTWVYVKNVPYAKFAHLNQSKKEHDATGKNKQAVTNMWNGMHLESEVGREAIQIYAESPHISNILACTPFQAQDEALKWAHKQAPKQSQVGFYKNPNDHIGPGSFGNRTARFGPEPQRNVLAFNNWRAPRNALPQPPGYGPMIAMAMQPSTPFRHGPPAFDGAAEVGSTPHSGRMFACIVDDDGNFVPVDPSRATIHAPIPVTNMRGQYYGQRFPQNQLSVENVQRLAHQRSGCNGGSRDNLRGGSRGGKFNVMNVHYHIHNSISPVQSDANSASIQHAVLTASMVSHLANGSSSARSSNLQHAASAAEFVPKSEANRALRQNTIHNSALKHAASTAIMTGSQASFVTQADPRGPVTAPSITGKFNIDAGIPTNDKSDKQSVDSYPSFFRDADSMAGSIARPGPTQQAAIPVAYKETLSQIQPAPVRNRSTDEGSPIRTPFDGSTETPSEKLKRSERKTASWVQKTPTNTVADTPAAADERHKAVANTLGLGQRAFFWSLIGRKKEIEKKLQSLEDHSTKEYCDLQSQYAFALWEIRDLGVDLGALQPPLAPETPRSAPASRLVSEMFASHITSPSHREYSAGQDIEDVPDEAYSSTHKRNRHTGSIGQRFLKGFNDLVGSLPTSKRSSSPVDSTTAENAEETEESEITDPLEGKTGGVRLFDSMRK